MSFEDRNRGRRVDLICECREVRSDRDRDRDRDCDRNRRDRNDRNRNREDDFRCRCRESNRDQRFCW